MRLMNTIATNPSKPGAALPSRSIAGPSIALIFSLWSALALTEENCNHKGPVRLHVDQGHPWRAPFGLDRVGRPPEVHIELAAEQAPRQAYHLAAYKDGRQLEQQALTFLRNPGNYSLMVDQEPPKFFAHVPLTSIPTEVVLYAHCKEGREALARQAVSWPEFEANASARPDRRINPVDLGTVLVPHDWLLLASGQIVQIEAAALSRDRDRPGAKLKAWFAGHKISELAFPLTQGKLATKKLQLPLSARGDHATLHVSVTDAGVELWRKEFPTMIVEKPPSWPAFGAVETKLRYDAPIAVTDSKTGALLPAIDYNTAWDEELNDVVVFLPNGSRFVFWRGSSYVPFWAGAYNTGVVYQWAETTVPLNERKDDSKDYYLEPLFDKDLRYGRVHIVESSASRVHVRWTYQLVDYRYDSWGDQAAEDFYFYPDGFGTRVLTAPNTAGTFQQVSEFLILTPQGAYPFEVLPSRILDVLSVGGEKGSITFPVAPLVSTPDGHAQPSMWSLPLWPLPAANRRKPTLYRIFAHKDDPASAIYFHPRDTSPVMFFLPFYHEGQPVTPAYWGSHWPLSRGGWTEFGINDRITLGPAHTSVAAPFDAFWPAGSEARPEVFDFVSRSQMLDALGRRREVTVRRWTWLIAHTDVSDEVLRDWGKSFALPPEIEVKGARLDFPSFSAERRALRLVADSKLIELKLKPAERTVNPVFEIGEAPNAIASVTINDTPLDRRSYAWDGAVLWVKAVIGEEGAAIGVRFQ